MLFINGCGANRTGHNSVGTETVLLSPLLPVPPGTGNGAGGMKLPVPMVGTGSPLVIPQSSTTLPLAFHWPSIGLLPAFHWPSTGLPPAFHRPSTGLPPAFHWSGDRWGTGGGTVGERWGNGGGTVGDQWGTSGGPTGGRLVERLKARPVPLFLRGGTGKRLPVPLRSTENPTGRGR